MVSQSLLHLLLFGLDLGVDSPLACVLFLINLQDSHEYCKAEIMGFPLSLQ